MLNKERNINFYNFIFLYSRLYLDPLRSLAFFWQSQLDLRVRFSQKPAYDEEASSLIISNVVIGKVEQFLNDNSKKMNNLFTDFNEAAEEGEGTVRTILMPEVSWHITAVFMTLSA